MFCWVTLFSPPSSSRIPSPPPPPTTVLSGSATYLAGCPACFSKVLLYAVHSSTESHATQRVQTLHQSAAVAPLKDRLDARGNLVKQLGNANLLVFAKGNNTRARETQVEIPAHDVDMPERAPIRTGIAECLPNYSRTISAHIVAAWEGLS